ncbi:MAG: Hypothetical protein AJITA_00659 [Acetilactobacillus jinshanensis]
MLRRTFNDLAPTRKNPFNFSPGPFFDVPKSSSKALSKRTYFEDRYDATKSIR